MFSARRIRGWAGCVLAIGLAGCGARTEAPRPEARGEPGELVELLRMEEAMTAAMARVLLASAAANPAWTAHLDILADYAEERIGWEALHPHILAVLSEQLTPAELGELIRFHRSPAGQAWIAAMPVLDERLSRVVEERFDADLDLLELRMKTREFDILMERSAFLPDSATGSAP